MSALRINITSESDPHSYEVTHLQMKPRKNSEAPTVFEPGPPRYQNFTSPFI